MKTVTHTVKTLSGISRKWTESGADIEQGRPRPSIPPSHGAGAELKKLLAKFLITSDGGCTCDARAAEMNMRGVEWCEQNIELICDWLHEAARQRGLPFVRLGAKTLVKLAIRRARKNNGREGTQEENGHENPQKNHKNKL